MDIDAGDRQMVIKAAEVVALGSRSHEFITDAEGCIWTHHESQPRLALDGRFDVCFIEGSAFVLIVHNTDIAARTDAKVGDQGSVGGYLDKEIGQERNGIKIHGLVVSTQRLS